MYSPTYAHYLQIAGTGAGTKYNNSYSLQAAGESRYHNNIAPCITLYIWQRAA